jgi:hypothetical protein
MIQDLDRTLEKMIFERSKLNKNEIDISFEMPNGEWSARLSRPTVNCWCYDLRENVKLRNMEMQNNRQGNIGLKRLPPRRFDLSYLITAWARRIEDQHQLLWRTLGGLLQVPYLAPDSCEGDLREQPYNLPFTIVNMYEHPISMTDLWSVLDNQMRLGFSLVVTLALDPEIGFEIPLVLEKQVRVGQSTNPSDQVLSALDVELQQKANGNSKEEDNNLKE